jgi:YgiT-type zinc finger domain-containing protein
MYMTSKPIPMCGKHHVQKEWRVTTFEYSEEGITIRVPNVYAWVCPESNEASFTPETVDELITTVRELLAERPDVPQTPQTSSNASASGCGPDGADIPPRAEGELSTSCSPSSGSSRN